jgi:hypothetical protein
MTGRTPTLALFGERDTSILPEKHRLAWDAAVRAAGNRDYTLQVRARANHTYLEARTGSNAEVPSLRRFVPEYRSTIREWLAKRIPHRESPR